VTAEERAKFKDLVVFVDENKMSQVTRNLLSNALKFTAPGGDVKVVMMVQESEQQLSVSITPHRGHHLKVDAHSVAMSSPRKDDNIDLEKGIAPRNVEATTTTTTTSVCNKLTALSLWKGFGGNNKVSHVVSEFSVEAIVSHDNTTQTLNLVYQRIPRAKPYGFLKISVIDSGPGIAAVRSLPLVLLEYYVCFMFMAFVSIAG
jgi:signal transduction histidine kinase